MGKNVKAIILRAWLPIAGIAIWWVTSSGSTSIYFPSLEAIVQTLRSDWLGPYFLQHLVPSLAKILIGFGIASLLGIAIGLFLGMNSVARAISDPFVQFLRALPPPVLLPIGILVFGIGATMNVFIIVIGAIWATLLNTSDGVRSLDEQLRDMSSCYRLSQWEKIRYVILPSAGPQIFSGLRTTLQISIILIVVSEMVGATSGIGYYILNSQQTFAVVETWAGTLVLGALGYCLTLIFVTIEKRILSWQTGLRTSMESS